MLTLLAAFIVAAFFGSAQTAEPLVSVQTIEIPNVPEGHHTDHLGIDLEGHRLFATMGEAHKVAVVDLNLGKVIRDIPVASPHAVLYRSDLDRIYVSDDDPTTPGLKIFSGRDYRLIQSIKLLKRTDSMIYDPNKKYLYIVTGGRGENLDYSVVSVVDTTTGERVGDIRISSRVLEDMALEASGDRLYVTQMAERMVSVVDRRERTVIATWPITLSKGNPVAAALDETNHILFVACRTSPLHGEIVIFDTKTGEEKKVLPTGGLLDYMVFDALTKRIYAVCSTANVYIYQQRKPDDYVLIGKPETALLARTGLLVPDLQRFFVLAPNTGLVPAEVIVFRVQ